MGHFLLLLIAIILLSRRMVNFLTFFKSIDSQPIRSLTYPA